MWRSGTIMGPNALYNGLSYHVLASLADDKLTNTLVIET